METQQASKIFACLSSGVRLDIWRNLLKEGKNGKVAGELSKDLALAPNGLSFHLKTLLHVNLVTVQQEGRYQRYRANTVMMNALLAYLSSECCVNEVNKSGELGQTGQISC